jgi:acetyl esterase/lipase
VRRDGLQGQLSELSDWAATHGYTPVTHRYGQGSEQRADLMLPAGEGPYPVAVLLHGGFWRAGFTHKVMDGLAADLTRRGWATWNVEYRRGGSGGGVPRTLQDVRAAIDALAGLDAPLDRARILSIGHSAGGQLALAAAGSVTAVVSLAGVCDLVTAERESIGDGAVHEFMAGEPAERPEAYAAADPIGLLPTGRPVLLAHGDADDRVPIAQSRGYARAARAAGDRCELLELAGVDHFAVIDPRTPAWDTIADRLEALMAQARRAAP